MPIEHAYCQKDSEVITISDTAIGFTEAILEAQNDIVFALCRVEGKNIRIDCINSPVAGTVGMLKKVDEEFEVWGHRDLLGFRAVRENSQDAKLSVLYFGYEETQ